MVLTGLNPSTAYYVRIWAVNAHGAGPPSLAAGPVFTAQQPPAHNSNASYFIVLGTFWALVLAIVCSTYIGKWWHKLEEVALPGYATLRVTVAARCSPRPPRLYSVPFETTVVSPISLSTYSETSSHLNLATISNFESLVDRIKSDFSVTSVCVKDNKYGSEINDDAALRDLVKAVEANLCQKFSLCAECGSQTEALGYKLCKKCDVVVCQPCCEWLHAKALKLHQTSGSIVDVNQKLDVQSQQIELNVSGHNRMHVLETLHPMVSIFDYITDTIFCIKVYQEGSVASIGDQQVSFFSVSITIFSMLMLFNLVSIPLLAPKGGVGV